ncbi:hypothetical protein OCAR_7455 [Afipia carboxidovorans OM5]|nr:hypothetical protein OCAR_7455 [Afipia carboxidovorans OM5]
MNFLAISFAPLLNMNLRLLVSSSAINRIDNFVFRRRSDRGPISLAGK